MRRRVKKQAEFCLFFKTFVIINVKNWEKKVNKIFEAAQVITKREHSLEFNYVFCKGRRWIVVGTAMKHNEENFRWPQPMLDGGKKEIGSLKQSLEFPFDSRPRFDPKENQQQQTVSHRRNYTNFSFLYQRALLFDFPRRYFEIEINISFFPFLDAEQNQFSSSMKSREKSFSASILC